MVGDLPIEYYSITKNEYVIVSIDDKKQISFELYENEEEFLRALEESNN